ncbi:MAG: diaminopimelate decarboxylase [Eubacteriales bacterium]
METSELIFNGAKTTELVKKYGTPLYVVSENYIEDRCKEIRNDFLGKYPNTRAAYASKAFLTLEMARIISREGLGMDVVSGGELFTAIKAGFEMGDIVFHGNNKSKQEIEMAIDNGVGRIVVDNDYELGLIENYSKEKEKITKILFRITPGVDSHTHKFISTGQLDSKFGIPLSKGSKNTYIEKALRMQNIQLMGFHFHVGSQLLENTSHLAALGILIGLMKEVKDDFGFETLEVNLGGGYGIHYTGNEERRKLSYFVNPMMSMLNIETKELGLSMPRVTIEPGRWIIGEAGITLYTIGSIKEIPGIRTYAAVDGGLPDNPRPALYDAKYEAVIANKLNEERDHIVTIAGKCCESGDILIHDLKVPRLQPGDILAVQSTGAYNYSMASNYNRIPRPAVVMIKDGIDRLIVRRETYEDLISREI